MNPQGHITLHIKEIGHVVKMFNEIAWKFNTKAFTKSLESLRDYAVKRFKK